jgi:hypothetical protein
MQTVMYRKPFSPEGLENKHENVRNCTKAAAFAKMPLGLKKEPEDRQNPAEPLGHIMARFYFYIRQNGRLHSDHDGEEFPDAEAAKREAVAAAHEIVADRIRNGRKLPSTTIVVTDELGHRVAVLPIERVLLDYAEGK